MTRRLWPLAALAVVALIGAGCSNGAENGDTASDSGSGSGSGTGTGRLPHGTTLPA